MNKVIFVFVLALSLVYQSFAQSENPNEIFKDDPIGRSAPNTITTAVPFLMIAPDSRAGGMGDAGAATSPDVNSMHWNPSKYMFCENEMGVAISYTPWLRQLVPDMNIGHIVGYYKLDAENTLAASLTYFSLGSITFTDIVGSTIRDFTPNEFSIDFAYSRLLGKKFSGAVAVRYIHSNLTGGISNSGAESHPGNSVAADVAFFYKSDNIKLAGMNSNLMWGLNISNIGNKMSYTSNDLRYFLPTNFRMGIAYSLELDEYNKLMLTVDMNKLLVPTPPVYRKDTAGWVYDDNGNYVIDYGKDPNISVPAALFSSWTDAPGTNSPFAQDGSPSVFREEFAEIQWSIGLEYWYSNVFALRAGYFNEHQYKGNRKYFSMGAGLKLNVFGLDFAYLIPTSQQHPLQNTLRFTLTFDIAGLNEEGS
ncbi:MAG: type IX secretion system outer membrane channel protein PorV [Bacteroidales bacterium]|nr:type IX secretion system outer membrane channel protein PorV [Bacteroidales bacterium]MDD4234610.1 type IX secretion system outer membrane channel protein PorV [Bacteroidales bacterium]